MPTPDEIAAFLDALPKPKEKDASAAKATEMLGQFKARGGSTAGPSTPQGYVGESLESLRKGASDVYQGAIESFGPQGFAERYREAPIPQAQAGALDRTIIDPGLRAGYSLATSPAAILLGETGAATGFAPLRPAPPGGRSVTSDGMAIPEKGGAAERSSARKEVPELGGKAPGKGEQEDWDKLTGGQSAGAAFSPYRPPPLAATEDLGARGLIQQRYGLAQRMTAHLDDLIENVPLKEPQAAPTGSQVVSGEPWYGVETELGQQPPGQELGPLKPQGASVQTNPAFKKLSFAQAEARASPDERKLFQRYIETRSDNPDLRWQLPPHLQSAADVHRSIMGDIMHMLQNVDPQERIGMVKDYLSHIYYETPEWQAWMSTRGRRGDIPTYEEAAKAGFTPRFNMVADINHAYIRSMNRYIAGREVENALKEQNQIVYGIENAPKGWEKINTGRFAEHPAYAPKAIARDYNRWYAQGFANDYTNAAMSLLQGLRSTAFAGEFRWHGLNEIHEATGAQLARLFDNLREGNIGRAVKAASQAATGPVSAYLRGRKGMRIYLRQNAMNAGRQALNNDLKVLRAGAPDDAELIDILTEAHAVPHWREFIDLQLNEESVGRYMHRRGMTIGNFMKAAGSNIGNIPGRISKEMKSNKPFLAKTIIAPAEVIRGMTGVLNIVSEPLFGHAIPRVKLGSNLQRLADWYAANPFSSRSDAIAAARKIGKAGDNVYGEMSRDTMWIHRGIQHALDLTFLAPGWNIGSATLAGRTAIGTARRALRTMSLGHLDTNAPSFSMSNAHWDPNMSAAYGGIVGSLLIGGAMTWFMTGKAPRDLLDYISPWTGAYKTDDKGRKVEVHLRPQGNLGWDASVASAVGAPAAGTQGWQPAIRGLENEFLNKLHPIERVAHDLMPGINSDFKGNPIYEPPLLNALGSAVRYAGQQMLPFTAQEKSAGIPGLWGDPNLPLLARLAGTAEAGMQWENPAGYVGMMRRKAGPIAEKRGKKKQDYSPVGPIR